MAKTTVTDLLEAGVHFGHQTRRWNPKMKPYIYGVRNGISIFDLTRTLRLLGRACDFLRETTAKGGSVLFVGTKRQAQETVRNAAEETDSFYMCHRWLGGTLTNNRIVLSRVNYMRKLQRMEAEGALNEMPKKEAAGLRRELAKLQRYLGGIANMRKLPTALVIVDTIRESIAVREANKLGIPVIAIADSNSNPDPIDYVVPGNDDAVRAIKVVVDAFTAAVAEGKGIRLKKSPETEESVPIEAPPAPTAAVAEESEESAVPTEPVETAQTPASSEEATVETETAEEAPAPAVSEPEEQSVPASEESAPAVEEEKAESTDGGEEPETDEKAVSE